MNPEDEKTINVLDLVSDGDVESPEEVNNSESKLKVLASHEEFASEVIDDDSPFPEVRAAVPSTDDVSLPQNTLRVWVLGLMLTTVGSAMNMLFSLHSPTFTITSFVTSILAYPIGKAWARFVPCWKIFGVSINPGPFNIKEHTLITVMSSVCLTGGAATATQILVAQNKFFGLDFGVAFAICSTLSTQTIGFAMAGITRKALVDSPGAIWPQNLVTTTFLTNLHKNKNHDANGWKISRLAFFLLVSVSMFFYYFLPGYMFQALSYTSFLTWIMPNNVVVNQVFGYTTGLGILPITFDWFQIAGWSGSPLIPPAGALASLLLGVVLIFWVSTGVIHYTNQWYSQYFPMASPSAYDRFGKEYNVSRVLDPKTLTLDEAKYKAYSPLFLSTTFATAYCISFSAIVAVIFEAILFHGKDIIAKFRQTEKSDVHLRLMRASYKSVPEWWYGIVFLLAFGASVATVRAWDTQMPVWALVLALAIGFGMLLPVGIVYALTNIFVGLNVITAIIIGYILPGKPLCMMFFKTFGYISNYQALIFAQDMKLGHYMKIQPRLMFIVQIVASVWSCLVQIAVMRWSYGNIPNLCAPDQVHGYRCGSAEVHYSSSLVWGAIGPKRFLGPGTTYNSLLWGILIGAMPLLNWIILRIWPRTPIRWLSWSVLFCGCAAIPPATGFNYSAYSLFGLFFSGFVKSKWTDWYFKYNYSLSAGLDLGLAYSSLVIFLCLTLPGATFPDWWGNLVINTPDYLGTAVRAVLKEGESFGPSLW
ncbi:small oligopeptide transporter, OPT family [Metschnikowia aff. pulcherrima]|uniref:Small oligopeptide transporter, OPT family n=1 Tax=Metschnikowia aff. pulcherrima TaxID=2163413 RepID=A0A4P6XLJ7_9ASCO|nr:small oligopeptide transporter, OPT family [Metschnikowia aff. pulcherrima]